MSNDQQKPARTARDATFDILKGLSIIEVMTHHVLGASMRKFAVYQSPEWWTMAVLSRILHFAVPTFLLVSAVLLARSAASRTSMDWRRFYARRVERTVIPYLVWTVLYIVFRLFVIRAPTDLEPRVTELWWIGSVSTPKVLAPTALAGFLVWGKAQYHIYFMVILLQFSLLFPLVLAGVQRVRLSFPGIVAAAVLLQVLVFVAQAQLLHLPYPASTILWYAAPAIVGVWLGVNWSQWDRVWLRWRIAIGLMAAAGLGVYLPLALANSLDRPISSMAYNVGIAAYCLGVALLLLALSRRIARIPRLVRVLQPIGDRSIVFFLVHPIVLYLVSGPTITTWFAVLPAPPVWVLCVVVLVTWALSEASRRLRLDRVLFAR